MRAGWRLLAAITVIGASAACSSSGSGPTPGGDGAAFQMIMLKEVPCPGASDATCAVVKITNEGATGTGRCRLRGAQTDAAGAETDVWGQWIPLNAMAAGTSITSVTHWHHGLAAVGYCEPDLRS